MWDAGSNFEKLCLYWTCKWVPVKLHYLKASIAFYWHWFLCQYTAILAQKSVSVKSYTGTEISVSKQLYWHSFALTVWTQHFNSKTYELSLLYAYAIQSVRKVVNYFWNTLYYPAFTWPTRLIVLARFIFERAHFLPKLEFLNKLVQCALGCYFLNRMVLHLNNLGLKKKSKKCNPRNTKHQFCNNTKYFVQFPM